MAASTLNKNNSAVKRIMQEAKELANDPSTDYCAAPLEDDIFEWHCTIRGPAGTDFEGGLYHFRILLPAEYPFRPPSLMMLTPNGRFELNTPICISFTSYHEELWQPAWGVRTAILGLQGFFPLKGQSAVGVGSIEYPSGERKRLASLSREWVCPHCSESNLHLLPDPPVGASSAGFTGSGNVLSSAVTSTPTATDNATLSAETAIIQTPSTLISPSNADSEPQPTVHSIDMPSGSTGTTQTRPPLVARAVDTPNLGAGGVMQGARTRTHKPPLLLDTAICVLLVMAFAMICRRVV